MDGDRVSYPSPPEGLDKGRGIYTEPIQSQTVSEESQRWHFLTLDLEESVPCFRSSVTGLVAFTDGSRIQGPILDYARRFIVTAKCTSASQLRRFVYTQAKAQL